MFVYRVRNHDYKNQGFGVQVYIELEPGLICTKITMEKYYEAESEMEKYRANFVDGKAS